MLSHGVSHCMTIIYHDALIMCPNDSLYLVLSHALYVIVSVPIVSSSYSVMLLQDIY